VQLLKSGTIDFAKGTVTVPLYEGKVRGKSIWYVLTDTTDKATAEALGINHSAKLAHSAGRSVRAGTLQKDATLTFDKGTVDFRPNLQVVPGDGDKPFPPKKAEPGSVGDRDYSPLVRVPNSGGTFYNAPAIAYDVPRERLKYEAGKVDHRVVHDKVVAVDAPAGTVTLALTTGFSFAKPVLYLSLDANDPLPSALENVTYAPALRDLEVGGDDSAFSPVERIFPFVNGPTGKDNPQRQGLNSALRGEGGPLNVLGGIPTVATDYSPMWDLNVGEWTKEAVDKGYRSRMIDEFQILGMVQRGFVTAPDGGKWGSTGFVVNCPIVHRFL
jgi:hypothetical protein